tara:strand:- start:4260 stop:5750 length:1491 start_codon:yes stop_codon:yes gene_type:complete
MKSDLDILLVHPNASNKIYQDLSKDFSAIEPPIWAAMIAKFLLNKGYKVDILDCEANRLNAIEAGKIIGVAKPRFVGVVVYGQQPSASTQNMVGAIELMKQVDMYGIPRIYLGAHPSALPKKTLLDDKRAFVCEGEGPYTLDALLQVDIFNEEELSTVPGLWYYDLENEEIKNTKPAPLITDLDKELPGLAWDLLPMDKYRTSNWHSWTNECDNQPFAAVYTSLGCPYKCTFCMINSPFGGSGFRYWSPEVMIKEFDKIAEMGIKNVKIADEMFVLNPKHFMALCELLIERDYGFNIWCYARVDTVKEKYLKTMKKAGINWVGLGIESGDVDVRQGVVKGKFQDLNIVDIVNKIHDHGINIGANYIFGLPNDTKESMQNTLDLAIALNTDWANFYCAMAYPGSKLHEEFSANNPEVLPEHSDYPGWIGYSQHAYETYNLPTETLTPGEVLAFRDEAFIKYFTNSDYVSRMTDKYGATFTTELDRMLSHTLKRKFIA